jgi:aromatic ring-cleaving dioxygenase
MKSRKTANTEPASAAAEADKAEASETMGRSNTPRKTEVRLGREVQARIGQQLRAMYDDIVNQGVPQHLSDIVRRLSEQDDGAA